jgi:hypothetical protein
MISGAVALMLEANPNLTWRVRTVAGTFGCASLLIVWATTWAGRAKHLAANGCEE